MAFPQPLVALFADYDDPQTTALTVSLTRVMFPTVLFSGVAFSLVGVLQAQDHFTAPALMSTVSNLVIIGYFYVLDSRFGIYGLAAAYLLGWFLQGVILLPPLHRLNSPLPPGLDLRSEGMKKVFSLMGPVMVSTWVQPITLAINARFGSRLYNGAGVSALEYASNLYLVIAGVFILSVTNVIFPRLSRLTAGGQERAFQDTIRQTVRTSLFFILPMSAGLMAVAHSQYRSRWRWHGPSSPSSTAAGSSTPSPPTSPPPPWGGCPWAWWATPCRTSSAGPSSPGRRVGVRWWRA